MNPPQGQAFCVVCGRFDREVQGRDSGLKCTECVGKKANPELKKLQQQRAIQLLVQNSTNSTIMSNHQSLAPDTPGSPTLQRQTSSNLQSGTLQAPPAKSPRKASINPASPKVVHLHTEHTTAPDIVEVPMDDITVTVEDPEMHEFEKDNSVTVIGTVVQVTTSERATMYQIQVVNKTNGTVYQAVRVRFSQCEPVFQTLKDIAKATLPDIPGKKQLQAMFKGFTKSFIEERRFEMERFLQTALRDRFLSRHPQLLELLRIKEEGNTRGPQGSFVEEKITQDMLIQWKSGPLLGRGAFGSVYMGLLPNSTFVAVKVISLLQKGDTTSEEQTAELRLLESLEHPNVVRYHGTIHNTKENQIEIFTEYVEGGSVASVVKRFGPLNFSVIRNYTRQLLDALVYLHAKGIAHRDIKGDNLLVAKHGEVKLADFGCSKKLASLGDTQYGEANTSLAGTPMWMAPEVIKGEGASLISDIWSVGCVIIEMLGREPWKTQPGQNAYAIMFKVQASTDPPDGVPSVEEMGSPLHDFLLECFNRDPSMRPSAQKLLQHEFLTSTDPAPLKKHPSDISKSLLKKTEDVSL